MVPSALDGPFLQPPPLEKLLILGKQIDRGFGVSRSGRCCLGDACPAGATFGPVPQAPDMFVHRPGERDRLPDGGEDMVGGDLRAAMEGVKEGAVDGFLEFCAGESGGFTGEGVDVEMLRVAGAAGEVYPQDFGTFDE